MTTRSDTNIIVDYQENTIKILKFLKGGKKDEVRKYLEGLKAEMLNLDKAIDYRLKMKELVSVAMGIVAVDYDGASEYVELLLSPLSKHCITDENPLIRYFTIESVVNLILILRENIFSKMWDFLLILLEVV